METQPLTKIIIMFNAFKVLRNWHSQCYMHFTVVWTKCMYMYISVYFNKNAPPKCWHEEEPKPLNLTLLCVMMIEIGLYSDFDQPKTMVQLYMISWTQSKIDLSSWGHIIKTFHRSGKLVAMTIIFDVFIVSINF